MRVFLFVLVILLSLCGYLQASVSATATVTVLKPLSITKEADMTFAEGAINEERWVTVQYK